MPLFEVLLTRSFAIKINAQSEKEATGLSEFFLGYTDNSTEIDRENYGFEFKEIEMTINDAMEVNKAED